MFDGMESMLENFDDVDIDSDHLRAIDKENKGIMGTDSAIAGGGNYDTALSYGNETMNNNLNLLVRENNGMMNGNCGTVAVQNNGGMENISLTVPPSNSGNVEAAQVRGFHHGNPANVNWSHEQNNGIMINNSATVEAGNNGTVASSDSLVLRMENGMTNNNAAIGEVGNNGTMRNNCGIVAVEDNGRTDNISPNTLPSNSGNGHVELVQGSHCGNSMNVDCSHERNNGIMNNSSAIVLAGNTCGTVLPEENGTTRNNTAMVVHQNNGNHGGIVIAENSGETRGIASVSPSRNPSNKHVEPVRYFRHENPYGLSWSREEQSILMEKLAEYENEPVLMKYIKIAAMLPKKTTRDVALRCKWMKEKRKIAEEQSAGRIKKEHSVGRISKDKKGKKVDTSQRTNNRRRQWKALRKAVEQILKTHSERIVQFEADFRRPDKFHWEEFKRNNEKYFTLLKKDTEAALNGLRQMSDDDADCPD